jgi:hypothetical protein
MNQTTSNTKATTTEWTPSVNKTITIPGAFKKPDGTRSFVPVRFPSNWRPNPAGKPLTNAKIAEYARMGRYGPEEKRKADYEFEQRHGIRFCIAKLAGCQVKGSFTKKAWDWLPKPGAYCQPCLAQLRAERDKEKNERKQWRENVKTEYV